MAGVGFDAHVVATVNLGSSAGSARPPMGWRCSASCWAYRFPRYRVALDDSRVHAGSVLVANARFYAGRFVAAPDAELHSPTFQVGLFERSGRLAAIGYALALFIGRLPQLTSYRILAAAGWRSRAEPGEPVQADGDIVAPLPTRIETAAGARSR